MKLVFLFLFTLFVSFFIIPEDRGPFDSFILSLEENNSKKPIMVARTEVNGFLTYVLVGPNTGTGYVIQLRNKIVVNLYSFQWDEIACAYRLLDFEGGIGSAEQDKRVLNKLRYLGFQLTTGDGIKELLGNSD